VATVRDLYKSFGDKTVLKGVSFDIHQKEILGILGPNGAGKTTLINILTGLLSPSKGYADVLGVPINKAERFKHLISVVPQTPALYEELTVLENLKFFANLYLPSTLTKQRIETNIQLLNLTNYTNEVIRNLSGGYKKRVSIAVALLNRPKILFLDEPTAGIDAATNELLFKFVKQIKSTMSVVVTTHSISEAEELCDRIMILDNGRIVSKGTPEDLSRSFANYAGEKLWIKFKPNDEETMQYIASQIKKSPAVKAIDIQSDGMRIWVSNLGDNVLEIVKFLMKFRDHIEDLDIKKPNLRNYFLHLVKQPKK
jgi:ABC-2 type transport system ATP-binding protein